MTKYSRILSWSSPSTHHLGGALDRLENADVRAAAALQSRQRVLDLRFARLLLVAQEGGSGHQPAVDAVTTLRHLLLDISGLQWVRLFWRSQTGQRRNLRVADGGQRCHAGARRLAVDMHGARATLRPQPNCGLLRPTSSRKA